MRKYLGIIVFLLLCINLRGQQSKLDSFLQFPRVMQAKLNCLGSIEKMFQDSGLSFPPQDVFWRCFKYEDEVELWAKDSTMVSYKLLKTYAICKGSGTFGPKRKLGDAQVPEGFYHIELFNPNSSYHLSFRVNYPNASDSILGVKGALGGQIYIHGGCLTIGCIPLTDKVIEEVFLISLYHKLLSLDSNEYTPVHIFPARMDEDGMNMLETEFGYDEGKMRFWNNLRNGYLFFEEKKQLPAIVVDNNGKYVLE